MRKSGEIPRALQSDRASGRLLCAGRGKSYQSEARYNRPFFLRSQYAYKAVAGMSLSGQVAESFPMMRSCLEYAGHSLVIKNTSALQEVFLNRHVDDTSKRERKAQFTIANTIAVIRKFDAKVATILKGFYDRTIDFGAHPNPVGMLSTLKIEKTERGRNYGDRCSNNRIRAIDACHENHGSDRTDCLVCFSTHL
jgi:hypothetical protein